jgi:hypothetical protein
MEGLPSTKWRKPWRFLKPPFGAILLGIKLGA